MLKWSVTTLSGRSCKWERMDAIPFLHTSEMWPRIQTPPGVLLRSKTPCLAQLAFTFNCCCYSEITSQRMMVEMTIICGEKSISVWQECSAKAQFRTLSVQKTNLQNTNSLSKPGFEFESSYLQGLLQEPATRGCWRHYLLHQPQLIPLHHRCRVQLLFLNPPRV